MKLLAESLEEFGPTYLSIAQDLSVVRHLSTRVAVMLQGRVVELEDTERLFDAPQHDCTRTLLAAVPDPDHRQDRAMS